MSIRKVYLSVVYLQVQAKVTLKVTNKNVYENSLHIGSLLASASESDIKSNE